MSKVYSRNKESNSKVPSALHVFPMPYILDLDTREITQIASLPRYPEHWWISASFDIERLVNDQHPHDIEWEYCPAEGMINNLETLVITQSRETAYNIEYYTRGGGHLKWTGSCYPARISF